MRYLLPAMLNTARPSLRMLALLTVRFTSAGVAQSAPLPCRYQAINGSRASACAGLRLMKALSVLSSMILTHSIVPPWDQVLFCGLGLFRVRKRPCVGSVHFRDFSFAGIRRRTPAPPPF